MGAGGRQPVILGVLLADEFKALIKFINLRRDKQQVASMYAFRDVFDARNGIATSISLYPLLVIIILYPSKIMRFYLFQTRETCNIRLRRKAQL